MDNRVTIRRIKLTRGKFAVVDASDFKWLNQWKWNAQNAGYAVRTIWIRSTKKEQVVQMHCLINGTPKGFDTDHINRNKLDNRRANLRTVTRTQNQQNVGLRTDNTSGYRGVSFYKRINKWQAQISINRQVRYLGVYSDLRSAWVARKRAERLYGFI